MKVCICNDFNDKAVQEYLESQKNNPVTIRETYNACSGGKKPHCGICQRGILKDMVDAHNNGITNPPAPPPP